MKKSILFLIAIFCISSFTSTIEAKSLKNGKNKRYTEYRIYNKTKKKSKSSKTYRYVDYYKQNKTKVNNK
jgi:hypothetical protein